MEQSFISWSGGKDAALAFWRLQQQGLSPGMLVTQVNLEDGCTSMHQVPYALIAAQAESMRVPLATVSLPSFPNGATYEKAWKELYQEFRAKGYIKAVFGDIFLEDLKAYREALLESLNMQAVLPLWQCDTGQLMHEFLSEGFRAVVVTVNGSMLDAGFCGREIDAAFLRDLPPGVDPAGERGEYHSFVYDGPIFEKEVSISRGVTRLELLPDPLVPGSDVPFYFCDLLPQ